MKPKLEHSDYVNQLRDDLNRMSNRISELEKQLADAVNGKLPEDQVLDPDMITMQSIVSSQTGEPRILLRWFTHIAQLDAESARAHAFAILDCVEAAKSDAFLAKFFREKLEADDNLMGNVLMEFRNYRAEQEGRE